MSGRVHWSYVQARLQARHGERPDEASWSLLEAARSLDHFLERSRATPLHRFTDQIRPQMSSHAIERVLRAGWRKYVAEVAAWVMSSWQPAVLWSAYIPDLPVLERLDESDAPAWALDDPILGPVAVAGLQKRATALKDSPLAPLWPATGGRGTLATQWFVRWRALWPRASAGDRQWLDKLSGVIAGHFERLARAGAQDTSRHYRHDLAHATTRIFRRCSGTPVAPFSHLALVALDLERLRGDLVGRKLFDTGHLRGPP